MAYDQSELLYIGPTRKEIREARREKRKARKEKRKILNDPGTNLSTMFSEGPRFIQAIRRKTK